MENIVQQSKVATLQWQLGEVKKQLELRFSSLNYNFFLNLQTEKSREMYKAVMKQVVTFLERAHRSLELLGTRLNSKQTVPRSKSEHQIVTEEELAKTQDYTMFRDFTW